MIAFFRAHSHYRAILFAVLTFTIWAFSDAAGKFILKEGVDSRYLMLPNAIGGLITIAGVYLQRTHPPSLKPRKGLRMALYAILFPINFLVIMAALRALPLAVFYAIAFLTPICVAACAAVLFHERTGTIKVAAIAMGFVGAVISINPFQSDAGQYHITGVFAALASMFIFTAQSLLMRQMGQEEEPDVVVFYPRLANLIIGIGVFVIMGWPKFSLGYLWVPLVTGLIGCFGWYLLAEAYKSAPASTVAPFHFTQIITGSILGYTLWNEVPGHNVYIGAAIIIAAALYIVRHSKPQPIVEEGTG